METNCAIHWIEIYPVDSAIRRLNNRGLFSKIDSFSKSLVEDHCLFELFVVVVTVARLKWQYTLASQESRLVNRLGNIKSHVSVLVYFEILE